MAELGDALLAGSNVVDCPGCRIDMKKKSMKGPPLKELSFVAVIVLSNGRHNISAIGFIFKIQFRLIHNLMASYTPYIKALERGFKASEDRSKYYADFNDTNNTKFPHSEFFFFIFMADEEVNLLSGSLLSGQCPGCRIETRKKSVKGPLLKELLFVALIVLTNALPISSLFPFLYFMVEDFGIAKTDKDIGYYAGYIGSAFMFGRFLTSTVWGVFSDKYGRKPVMIIGTSSIIIFNTLFGFSTSFWMALTSRFLLGLFNGMLGPVRAYATEVCTEEYAALGLSMVGTFWGLGLIVGPAVGGYLAQPNLNHPSLFPHGSLFDKFPFALPCLAISLFAVVVLVISFWAPETMHNHPLEEIEEVNSSEKMNGGKALNVKANMQTVSKTSLLRNWGLLAAIALFCIWGLHDVAYTEIFSLWAVSPRENGGLSLTTSDVGVVLAISGAALLLFQLFFFPPLANLVGPIRISRYPAVLSVPLVVIYPLIANLRGVKLWLALVPVSIVKNVFSASISTGSFLLINNSVLPSQRGAANGLSMSFMSLFKALGPLTAGALFSWSQKRVGTAFLPGSWMTFSILGLCALICVIITIDPILPKALNKSKHQQLLENDDKDPRLKRPSSFTFE